MCRKSQSCVFWLSTDTSMDQPYTENGVGEILPGINLLRKERHCQGMLEYRKEDEAKLFRTLITGDVYSLE